MVTRDPDSFGPDVPLSPHGPKWLLVHSHCIHISYNQKNERKKKGCAPSLLRRFPGNPTHFLLHFHGHNYLEERMEDSLLFQVAMSPNNISVLLFRRNGPLAVSTSLFFAFVQHSLVLVSVPSPNHPQLPFGVLPSPAA